MRVELSRFPLQAATMHFQSDGLDFEVRPAKVIAFPTTPCRTVAATIATASRSSPCSKRPAAITGAALNARLLILLGICTTSAIAVLSAVLILQDHSAL